jgi:hypothetical protein
MGWEGPGKTISPMIDPRFRYRQFLTVPIVTLALHSSLPAHTRIRASDCPSFRHATSSSARKGRGMELLTSWWEERARKSAWKQELSHCALGGAMHGPFHRSAHAQG